MNFRYNHLQQVCVRLTEKIGWVNARMDVANGGKYYRVAHQGASGDYQQRWYAEHELQGLAEGDPREAPGLSYIDPPGPPPGGELPPGEGDAPGEDIPGG
jgi:hypothetical protein